MTTEEGLASDPWKARAQEARAQVRDLTNKLAAVAEARDSWRRLAEQADWSSYAIQTLEMCARDLDAILNPPPPFDIPSKPGAGIMATWAHTGNEHELRLYGGGFWRADGIGGKWRSEDLAKSESWSGFRLIEEEDGK